MHDVGVCPRDDPCIRRNGGPVVGSRDRLLHLRPRIRTRLALHRGDQRHSGQTARNARRCPDVGAAVAVRPHRQGQGHLLHARMRHRDRPDRRAHAGRGRHHPPRGVVPQRSRDPRRKRDARAARAWRRAHRRRHSAARVRGGRVGGDSLDRRSATSPGTGSTPTIPASGSPRRCCRPFGAHTPRRRWRFGSRCRAASRTSPM